jgi:hypothetical protein
LDDEAGRNNTVDASPSRTCRNIPSADMASNLP